MHNAIKGAGIGAICLGVYLSITSIGAAGSQVAREGSDREDTAIGEFASTQEGPAQTPPLENAIRVAFSGDTDRSPEEEKLWREAVDHLRASITSRGYRCVVPYEFSKIDATLYGIGCVNNRERTGQTNYLVNVRTGDVEPL